MVLPVHEAEEHSSHRAILTWLYATPSPSSQGNWRSGLAERPSNIMSQRSESPSKKRRRAREDHGASDPEITPRSPRFAINLPPPPPPPRSPSRSSASTQSNRSQRSASPAKRMMDLLLRPHPTISVQFGTPDVAMPEALQAMLSMVKQFARGLGVVSESCLVGPIDSLIGTQFGTKLIHFPSPRTMLHRSVTKAFGTLIITPLLRIQSEITTGPRRHRTRSVRF